MNNTNYISIEEAAQILNKSDSATRHFIDKGLYIRTARIKTNTGITRRCFKAQEQA